MTFNLLLPLKLVIQASKQLAPYLPQGKMLEGQQEMFLQSQNSLKSKRKVREGEIWFVPGKKGMGKTTFIKAMIRKLITEEPGYVVYHVDTKHRGDFNSKDGRIIVSEFAPPASTIPGDKIVWQPVEDNKEQYSKFFKSILDAGVPAIVNIDESANMEFGSDIPRGLRILLKQCRLPGIHVLGGAQEIANSPRQLLSQADHIACFNLINEYDERLMLRYLGMREEKSLGLKRYQILYRRPDMDASAKLFNSFEELLLKIH